MKNIPILSALMLSLWVLGSAQSTPRGLLLELVQQQQGNHSAIGWVDAGAIDFIAFGDKPMMHSYKLPGPALWAASLHGASGEVFGELKSDGKRTFAAVGDGKVLWENPDLINRGAPEVSPSGKVLALEGRDKKTGADGLLIVEDRGQRVTQVSRDGKNPSWSSNDTKFVYEDKGEILIYDLPSQHKQRMGVGTLPSWSPDGKWITYRTQKDQFVLADTTGTVQRVLLGSKRVLTMLHWSPNSEYLMYVEKSRASGSLNCPNAKDVVAYRLRDGQSAPVFQVCEGYPFWVLRWVQLPSNVPLA